MTEDLYHEKGFAEAIGPGKHWVYLLAAVVVGITTAMLVPILFGNQLHPHAAYYSVFVSTLSFAAIWKFRAKSIWNGGGIGAVAGVLMFLLALLISSLA
ncbi:MAG TPA: hypothetical protein DCM54_12855 [Gammaproteobacteria bacterium]|nr:hypothetical protein [Gammaproteobacteria bacterium]|tara:strand:+ start:187 stop:483 length:297 start_codon:yes stop_codon:yes gene_type:complete